MTDCILCGKTVEQTELPLCVDHSKECDKSGLVKFTWKHPKLRTWMTMQNKFDLLNKIHYSPAKGKK